MEEDEFDFSDVVDSPSDGFDFSDIVEPPQQEFVSESDKPSQSGFVNFAKGLSEIPRNALKSAYSALTDQLPQALSSIRLAGNSARSQELKHLQEVGLISPTDENVNNQLNQHSENIANALANIEENKKESASKLKGSVQNLTDVHDFNSLMNWAGTSGGQALGQIPVSVATGGQSSFILESAEVYDRQLDLISEKTGLSREEVVKQGLDKPASGQAYALLAGALDMFSAGKILGIFKKEAAKGVLKNAITNGLTEFLTEGTQGQLENKGASVGAGTEYKFDPEQFVNEGAAGMIGGSGLSLATSLTQKRNQIDEVINKVADTGSNELNAQIDSEITDENKTRKRTEVQGTEVENQPGKGSEEPSGSSSVNRNEEVRGAENGLNGQEGQSTEGFVNAETVRSNEGQVSETGSLPESSENKSSEDLQQQTPEESGNAKKQVTKQAIEEQRQKVNDLLFEAAGEQGRGVDLDIFQEAKKQKEVLRQMENEYDRAKVAKEEKAAQVQKLNVATLLKEQIQAHYKNIETGVKKGREMVNNLLTKITDVAKEHKLTPRQISALVNKVKATNLFTPGSLNKLSAYVEKVANDADYAERVEDANDLRSKIRNKTNAKGISFKVNQLAKAFSKIDPSQLPDDMNGLGLYQMFAEDIVNHYKNPGQKDYAPLNAKRIQNFIDTVKKYQSNDLVQAVRDRFGFGEEVTDEDIENYIDSENELDEDPFGQNRTEAQNKIVRDKILKVAEYSQVGLQNFQHSENQDKIDRIANMDLSVLDNSQLVDYIRTVDNMIENQDFSNTDRLDARAKAIEGFRQLKELVKDQDLKSLGGLKRAFYSLPQIFKTAYKSSELAAEAYRLTGLADFYNATSRVESQEDVAFKEHLKKFNELSKKYKGFSSAKTQTEIGVFGALVRYPKNTDPIAALEQSKRNIEMSIPRLAAKQPELAADVAASYEKFKDAKTIEEVFDIMKKTNQGGFEMWQFWKDQFDNNIKSRLQKVAAEFHNEDFVEEENYTPKKFTITDSTIPSPDDSAAPKSNKIGQRKQSNTAKAASNSLLPGYALNFNFYETMFKAYRESLYDIEATRPQQVLHEFFKLKDVSSVLGGVENKDGIIENFKKSELIARSYGDSYKAATEFFNEVSSFVRTLSYTRALGGVTQFFKQYPSVAVSAMINLGADANLFFRHLPEGTNKLLDMYTIGQRGRRLGGVSMGEAIRHKVQSAYANKFIKGLGQVNKLTEKGSNIFMKSLTLGDVTVAQRSWIAYYLQGLKKNGIDPSTVDLSTEHEKQGDEARKKAAAFAEQKVKETQLVSNPEELATFFKSTPGAEQAIKNFILPFSSFAINTKVRLAEGTSRIISDPTNLSAYKEMGAVAAEIVTFNLIRYYLIQAGINLAVKPMVESMFNLKAPKKKEKEEDELKFKQFYSDILKEALPTTIGTGLTSATVGAINYIGYLVENPHMTFEQWKKAKKEFLYNYSKPGVDFGLYSVGLNTLQQFYTNAKLSYDISAGNKLYVPTDFDDARVKLTHNQKEFVLWTNLFDVLALTNFMDADVYNLVQRINREQLKRGKQRASGN